MIDEATPPRSSLYGLFQDWRRRLSNSDFSVIRGRIFPRQSAVAVRDTGLLLDLFEMVARHGLELSREAERWVNAVLARLAGGAEAGGLCSPDLWRQFRQILVLPHAADALRAMHRTDALTALFPEFRSIDCLVVRDFYHRYTVDEHSFMAIEHLHALGGLAATQGVRRPASEAPEHEAREGWERSFTLRRRDGS